MSDFKTILCSVVDDVGVVSLNRPERLNALTPHMFHEIIYALEALPAQGARAVLLKAEGKGFCSGTDLQADGGLPEDVGEILEDDYNPCMERFRAFSLPMVAQVHGACAGIGASLALACDFVIASKSSYFLQAFVNIGLVPDGGATWTLPRLVGRARATQMMMLGERIGAEQAENWGLIYKAVDDGSLADEAWALAKRLAVMPTVALRLIRKGMSESQDMSFSQGLALERVHQRDAGCSADFKEGVQAFFAKRPAKFEGK